ncbi:MAG: hypothetical protein JJU05_13010 [Verrucomicrobia bacterium]|nr:hypothetical protein [Verrucomicrobiota bacterium]MCH8528488.1 hypothetical protein [Kiritimatiellia bacterium]
MRFVYISAFFAFTLFGAITKANESVKLTNLDGRSIEARILRFQNDAVDIQTADNRLFTIRMDTLDKESQERVRSWQSDAWMESNPLDITITRRKVDRNVSTAYRYRRETARLIHTVQIQNRRMAREIPKLEVRFILYYRPRRYYAMTQRPTITYKGTTTIETLRQFGTDSFEMRPIDTYSWRHGSMRYEDEIDGIWIRFYENGKLIGQHQEPPSYFTGRNWDTDFRNASEFP